MMGGRLSSTPVSVSRLHRVDVPFVYTIHEQTTRKTIPLRKTLSMTTLPTQKNLQKDSLPGTERKNKTMCRV